MRVAYIAHLDFSKESGILKKIRDQVIEWKRIGLVVEIFVLSPNNKIWEGFSEITVNIVADRGIARRLCDTKILTDKVENWEPDLIYLRFEKSYPAFEVLAGLVPTVLEVNTDDIAENAVNLRFFARMYHRLTRHRLIKKSSGVIAVTKEIGSGLEGIANSVKVIANGIDLSLFDNFTHRASGSGNYRLVFIGSEGYIWHGIDKIYYLAEKFPHWEFTIIGMQPNGALHPSNISFVGNLKYEEYKDYLLNSDVAIGTLALHRKNMDEASPLKTREYLAHGLPVIIGYLDTDFPQEEGFILRLPNEQDSIEYNLQEIKIFVEKSREISIDKSKIAHIDINHKENIRIDYFKSVIISQSKRI